MRARRTRERSKGVAVIELALSMTFLIPLMSAAVDFGYYFYVGTSAEEAARQGAVQAVRLTGGTACGSVQANNANALVTNNYATGTGINCMSVSPAPETVSAVYCYMNEDPLRMGQNGGPTAVTSLTCDNTPVANSWHIQVDVSFPLILGMYRALLPAGTVSGTVRYRALATATP